MADGLNKVMLIGNLGADPELRMTNGGQAVLKIRMACSESYLDRNKVRQERTEWMNVVVWGRRAEALGKILSKGNRIFIEGGLRTSSYEDREGVKRYKTEVTASNIILMGGRRNSGGEYDGPDDDEPRGESRGRRSDPPAGGGGGSDDADYGGSGGGDDDIPFAFVTMSTREPWWKW
jgi:single-strand DNA-binding protein